PACPSFSCPPVSCDLQRFALSSPNLQPPLEHQDPGGAESPARVCSFRSNLPGNLGPCDRRSRRPSALRARLCSAEPWRINRIAQLPRVQPGALNLSVAVSHHFTRAMTPE